MKQLTLQEQYNLIKEGKGHKQNFFKAALAQYPNLFTPSTPFDQVVTVLNQKNIISEGPKNEGNNQLDFFKLFEEKLNQNEYDFKDKKAVDNLPFNQVLTGYYAEMKNPKNAEKTEQQLKDIVYKNLSKDPMYYITKGQFGEDGVGYTEDAPGLGKTKEVTGKFKSSGMEPVKLSESMYADSDLNEVGMFHDPRMSGNFKDADDQWENGAYHVRFRMLKNKGVGEEKAKELADTYEDKPWEEVKRLLNLNEVNIFDVNPKAKKALEKLMAKGMSEKDAKKAIADKMNASDREDERAEKRAFGLNETKNKTYADSDGDDDEYYDADKEQDDDTVAVPRDDKGLPLEEDSVSEYLGGRMDVPPNYGMDDDDEYYSNWDYDKIANEEFGMDYDQLGPNEQAWVRDEADNIRENISNTKMNEEDQYPKYNPNIHKTLLRGYIERELKGDDVCLYLPFEEEETYAVEYKIPKSYIEGMTGKSIETQDDLDELDSSLIHTYVKYMLKNPKRFKPSLQEAKKMAVNKMMKEIDILGDMAGLNAKINAITEKIEELQNKLTMTESEEMSDIVDTGKIKEIKKSIKLLEKKKGVYEKIKSKMDSKFMPKEEINSIQENKPTSNVEKDIIEKIKASLKQQVGSKIKSWDDIVKDIRNSKSADELIDDMVKEILDKKL